MKLKIKKFESGFAIAAKNKFRLYQYENTRNYCKKAAERIGKNRGGIEAQNVVNAMKNGAG